MDRMCRVVWFAGVEGRMAAEGELIEVGQNGPEFRLWLATEARRQGEIRLAAQASAVAALEARATSILQWSVGIAVALTAVILGASAPKQLIPCAATLALLGLSALMCVTALWPKNWHPGGYDFHALVVSWLAILSLRLYR